MAIYMSKDVIIDLPNLLIIGEITGYIPQATNPLFLCHSNKKAVCT